MCVQGFEFCKAVMVTVFKASMAGIFAHALGL